MEDKTGYTWTGRKSGQRYQEYLMALNLGQKYTAGQAAGTAMKAYEAEVAARSQPDTSVNTGSGEYSSSDTSNSNTSIKIATPDLMVKLVNESAMQPDIMTDLIFELIGGQEIINISRNDLVNGQNIKYQPIKNLSDISFQYNSKNILSLENTSETVFNNFPIKLETHIPFVGNGPNGTPVYIEPTTGNLVIDVVNMETGEQIEVQIMTSGTLLDDTIYTG